MAAMPTAPPNAAGIELFYETFGEPDGEPLLFVMGLGAQGHVWDDEFVQAFVDRGFFAIRFDNRDVGLSTKPEGIDPGVVAAGILAAFGGDAVDGALPPRRHGRPTRSSLLDHLGIDVGPRRRRVDGRDDRPDDGHRPPRAGASAHVDHVDHRRPRRRPARPGGRGAAAAAAAARPRRGDRRAVSRSAGPSAARTTSTRSGHGAGPRSPTTAASTRRASATSCWPSSPRPSRTEALGAVDVPALVIHGDSDPLVTPSGGRRTAEAIPGAELLVLEGMGHDLPPVFWPHDRRVRHQARGAVAAPA